MNEKSKITMTSDDGSEIELYVVEQTTLGGVSYYLAADKPEGDAEAYILKDESGKEDTEAVFTIVSDETELEAVSQIFEGLLDDTDIS
ncbi:MAG: hypothetical protein BWY61_00799 [Firmicutes bacterium ADurb.Bin354]|mgnify:CR=1 FL=1|nr:MAG: hypothetical protein BWY61_00799 [Firmicutes bacterium ADurb.Bin354]SCY38149.1 Protein of unknown function [Lachnospiraceae bacterium XPB1003]